MGATIITDAPTQETRLPGSEKQRPPIPQPIGEARTSLRFFQGQQPLPLAGSLSLYFSMTPQAMRSPELPDGSDIKSSAFAWMTSAVPPSWKSEFVPSPRVTPLATRVVLALPSLSTTRLGRSP